MKLIAVNTIQARKTLRAPDARNPKDRGRYQTLTASPGDEFDTAAFGIDDAAAQKLVASGAAKHKMVRAEADEVPQAPKQNQAPGAGAPQA